MKFNNNSLDRKELKRFLYEFWYAPCDGLLRVVERNIWKETEFKLPVLDIGIGDGRFDRLIYRGKNISVGIDPNSRLVDISRKWKIFKKVDCQSAEDMSFKDGTFGTVVSNSTFEHINDDIKAIKEVSRVLKKGGCFYITVPSDSFLKEIKKLGVNKKQLKQFNKRVVHKHYRNLQEWKKIMKKYRLNVEESFNYFSPRLFRFWWYLFRIITFKPYHRELWSYLKDSPYGKYFPKRLITNILYVLLLKSYQNEYSPEGVWTFIKAKKI